MVDANLDAAAFLQHRRGRAGSSVPFVRIENGVPDSVSARDDAGHQPVAALGPLIGIRVGAERDGVAPAMSPAEFLREDVHDIDLDHDLAVEVVAGIEVEIFWVPRAKQYEQACVQPRYGFTVQSKGIAEAPGTWLSALLHITS